MTDSRTLDELIAAKVRATFGFVITTPHPDSLEFIARLIAKAPASSESSIAQMAISLIGNLRGELSEQSYAAVSRILAAIAKRAALADMTAATANPASKPGFTPVTPEMLAPFGFAPMTAENAAKFGTAECPCMACAVKRMLGIPQETEGTAPVHTKH